MDLKIYCDREYLMRHMVTVHNKDGEPECVVTMKSIVEAPTVYFGQENRDVQV